MSLLLAHHVVPFAGFFGHIKFCSNGMDISIVLMVPHLKIGFSDEIKNLVFFF